MKIRIFFTNYIDSDNFNAQSLNVREIALRLDPRLFRSTLFYERVPDHRLLNRSSIRLIKIPSRFGSLKIYKEFFRGQDIIFRANLIRFTYFFLIMPNFLRQGAKMVEWFEGPAKENLIHEPRYLEVLYTSIISRVPDRVAMSKFIAESNFRNYGFKSDRLIPAGVDTRLFCPPPGRNNNSPTVLFIGTLVERKGPRLVLEAARLFPGTKFILVGAKRGNYYKILEQMVQEWELHNVTFVPPIPHNKLATLMQKCDILLHPSEVEGVSKVTLEAAATGMPVLMFDWYDTPTVIDGVTGFLVKNQKEMLDRCNLLIKDQELRLRMGNAAIMHAKMFDWDIIAKLWEMKFLDIMMQKIIYNN